ncbi:Arogenate dehydrogenase, partial [uncultured Microcoleus sp.]
QSRGIIAIALYLPRLSRRVHQRYRSGKLASSRTQAEADSTSKTELQLV